MAKNVFILGAGASVDAGAPLMSNFLDMAEDLLRAQSNNIDAIAFTRVFRGLAELQVAHSKAMLETQNVESVFGAFEMAHLFQRLGSVPREDIDRLPADIATLIVQTVENSIRMPLTFEKASAGRMVPTESYSDFASLLGNAHKGNANSVAVLTFNYDAALDYALHYRQEVGFGYCLDEGIPSRGLDLLKLHGSVNWGLHNREDGEQEIKLLDLGTYFNRNANPIYRSNQTHTVLRLSSMVDGTPFIVPPTWSKLHRYASIAPVWRKAAKHLSEAENIFVMGYSLPPSDNFFRLLYALGTAGETRLRRFWVFDPDTSGTVRKRFEELLGQAVAARFGFKPWTFKLAVKRLARIGGDRFTGLPDKIDGLGKDDEK